MTPTVDLLKVLQTSKRCAAGGDHPTANNHSTGKNPTLNICPTCFKQYIESNLADHPGVFAFAVLAVILAMVIGRGTSRNGPAA